MKIIWSPEAKADLSGIYDYIAEDNLHAAFRLQNRIIDAAESLSSWPDRGRPGKWGGPRELVLTSTPYLVIYQRRDDTVFILRIIHGAQLWPPADGA